MMKLKKKLSKMIKIAIITWILGQIPIICTIFIPLLHRNTYISYLIMTLLIHMSTWRYLYATSSDVGHTSKGTVETKTKIPNSPSTDPLATFDASSNGNNDLPLFNPFTPTPSIHRTQASSKLDDILLDNIESKRASSQEHILDLTGKLDYHHESSMDLPSPRADTLVENPNEKEELV